MSLRAYVILEVPTLTVPVFNAGCVAAAHMAGGLKCLGQGPGKRCSMAEFGQKSPVWDQTLSKCCSPATRGRPSGHGPQPANGCSTGFRSFSVVEGAKRRVPEHGRSRSVGVCPVSEADSRKLRAEWRTILRRHDEDPWRAGDIVPHQSEEASTLLARALG